MGSPAWPVGLVAVASAARFMACGSVVLICDAIWISPFKGARPAFVVIWIYLTFAGRPTFVFHVFFFCALFFGRIVCPVGCIFKNCGWCCISSTSAFRGRNLACLY